MKFWRECVAAFVALMSLTVVAQVLTSVSGTVTDQSGAVLSGVTVTLVASDRQERTAVSGPNGRYVFVNVVPGTYDLRAVLEGFAIVWRQVSAMVGQTATVDIVIGLAPPPPRGYWRS